MVTLQWLAGYFDANASIVLAKTARLTSYVAEVRLVGSDSRACDLLTGALRDLGVEFRLYDVRYDLKAKKQGKNHARGWFITVAKIDAVIRLLEVMTPLLLLKQDRAELALEFATRRKNNPGVGRAAVPYEERDHEIYRLIKDLQTSNKSYPFEGDPKGRGRPMATPLET